MNWEHSKGDKEMLSHSRAFCFPLVPPDLKPYHATFRLFLRLPLLQSKPFKQRNVSFQVPARFKNVSTFLL